ncbi:MAG: exodeoxyribonuclease VII small subunit [Oligoflexia bacterium]|nr:exodeoxyribonuclease VII small subunit [Oligoflexia bacterium]
MSAAKNKTLNWEDSIQELEKIVKEFEQGNLSLEDSLNKFERGVNLYKVCRKALTDAEKRVKVLSDSLKEEDLQLETEDETEYENEDEIEDETENENK